MAWASGILYRLYKRLPSSGECQINLASQPALQCNVSSHWLGTFTEWSLTEHGTLPAWVLYSLSCSIANRVSMCFILLYYQLLPIHRIHLPLFFRVTSLALRWFYGLSATKTTLKYIGKIGLCQAEFHGTSWYIFFHCSKKIWITACDMLWFISSLNSEKIYTVKSLI